MEVGPILAALPREQSVAVGLDGSRAVVACGAAEIVSLDGAEAFDRLDRLGPGWWAGFAAYDLGRSVERVRPRAAPSRPQAVVAAVPDLCFIRFAAYAEIDRRSGRARLSGHGPARRTLETALDSAGRAPVRGPALGPWRTSLDRPGFEAGVRTIVEHIEAGDCYQVNLTRQLTCDRAADPVALWCALETGNPAPHATLLRIGSGELDVELAIVSASPERFLRVDGRHVETRPIKGTGVSPTRLRASAKDRAENVMIVDLARNDLGRVCEPGSVHVPGMCELEPHPGLVHLVSTVRGRLRADVGLGGLLRATFPPASVTGAPKPGVLQEIEDLEPVRRGVYCGAVGWIDTVADRADLAVAIRTFTVTPGSTQLGVGGGITADSDPGAEWQETELKAARLLTVAGAGLATNEPISVAHP
ncbi:MAG: anthranilate synthase component I family protein [Acidimicrobiia bacterium]